MSTTVHNLDAGQIELDLALDQRHEIRLPGWELIELDGLGERPPAPPPLAWGGLPMASSFAADEEPADDDDWELEELRDPEPDDPDPEDECIDWVVDPDDWELEELEAVGERPAEPAPLAWSGSPLVAASVHADADDPSEDDDWELESLDGDEDEDEDEDEPEDQP